MLCKKDVLRNFAKFIKKETLSELFSCEFCKISNNTFSYRTRPVAASDISANIFCHVDNYIIEKHGSKEKNIIINGFQSIFKKINGNADRKLKFNRYMKSEEIVFLSILTGKKLPKIKLQR